MKKNNKGFFLAETIVMIALVTSIMAFVYPNVSKLYENYKDRAVYYDQTEDIYKLKYVYDYLLNNDMLAEEYWDFSVEIFGIINFPDDLLENSVNIKKDLFSDMNLKKLYITKYMVDLTFDENNSELYEEALNGVDLYEFNRYIKRLKKTTYDTSSYRLIGIFEYGKGENKITRYASIKIDNPNPVSTVGDNNE